MSCKYGETSIVCALCDAESVSKYEATTMTDKSEIKLGACPFCRGHDVELDVSVLVNGVFAGGNVFCNNCGACGPECDTKERAISTWNTLAGLAGADRDVARINFLDSKLFVVDISDDEIKQIELLLRVGNINDRQLIRAGLGRNLREAIDAAQAAEKKV